MHANPHHIHTPAVTPWQPSSISALVLTFRPPHPYHCTPARRFTLVPVRIAIMVAQDERKPHVLRALGGRVPPKWTAQEKRDEDERAGVVDYVNESVLENDEDCDGTPAIPATNARSLRPSAPPHDRSHTSPPLRSELAELALEAELLTSYAQFQEHDADETDARSYCLRKPSAALTRELELFRAHRSKAICRFRSGTAVLNTTAASDVSTLMRLLGFIKVQYLSNIIF